MGNSSIRYRKFVFKAGLKEMISDLVQKSFDYAPHRETGSKFGVQGVIERKVRPFAIGCVALVGMMTIAAASIAQPAVAQASTTQRIGQSTSKTTTPYLICTAEAHGSMCNPEGSTLKSDGEHKHAAPEATKFALSQSLSNVQMEHFADLLLRLIYVVMPVGLGLSIFLHDRHRAMINAQIERLEKLWQQSSQA